VIVSFNQFKDLIDAEGGITINVPEAILSNRFDCPYPTRARCLEWKGWRFHRGTQHMNGEQALIYSRIRENQLNPGETDLTRAARQQAVAQAAEAKLASVGTVVGLPLDGNKLMKPLATDLSTWQLIELGWVKFRASGSHTLYCRLGGDATSVGGSSVLLPSEDNRSVLAMWAGLSAPQPPTTTFGPGCRVGHPLQ
jgi:anionic cell wall polymer biosynthesis LytR-Cps2A-Psr (LCP) family protein